MQPPLVAHIIYSLDTGGMENGLVNILNRCPVDRYRHVIICLSTAEDFATRVTVPGIEVIELKKKPGHDLGMYMRLWSLLRRLKPAIIHSRNLAALECQVVGLLSVPRAKRVHGEHGRDFNDLDGSNKKYRALRKVLQPVISRYITVSQDLANWLQDSLKIRATKITQIYNGVDCNRFTGATPAAELQGCPANFEAQGNLIIGTVGRLAAVKNQQLLIDSIAHLLSQQPDLRGALRCMLVGEGPERDALERRIAKHELEDIVWLVGDSDNVPALLSAMHIFVLPSLNEGISNTILEAMASSLAVVATDVGGTPELISPGVSGVLVPSNDVAALAQALAVLLAHPQRIKEIGNASRQYVESHFDWAVTVTAYLKVYDDVLGVHPVSHEQGGS